MTKKMILAEDDQDFREGLVLYIGDEIPGVEIEYVDDGKPLLERARNGGYALILTDNDMKQMNGLEAVRRIREFDKTTPIYLMSGRDVRKQALEAGATGYIPKDFDFAGGPVNLSLVLKPYLG